MSSIQPRKQRKAMYNTPLHQRRKQIASHLSEELLLKYNLRTVPVVTGDEVKIMRGGSKGKTGKVVEVDTKKRRVVVEGVTHKKADGTDVALPLDASNLLVTKLNLEDKRRRTKIGESEAPKAAKAAKPAAKAADKAPAKAAEKPAAAPAAKAADKAPAAPATETKEASE
jgi:large subunit ribosomal protein L24